MQDLVVDFIISFDGYPDVALEMVDNRTFDGRLQFLGCAPTVLDRPPLADQPAD
jgi:hypothetical protein